MARKKWSYSLYIPNASLVYFMQSTPVQWNKTQEKSLEFTINRTLMKLFRTVSSDVIKECRCFFGITDTKLLIVKRKMKFVRKYCNSENGLCILFADAASLERKMLAIWVATFRHNYFVSTFICLFACFSFITAAYCWWIKLLKSVAATRFTVGDYIIIKCSWTNKKYEASHFLKMFPDRG